MKPLRKHNIITSLWLCDINFFNIIIIWQLALPLSGVQRTMRCSFQKYGGQRNSPFGVYVGQCAISFENTTDNVVLLSEVQRTMRYPFWEYDRQCVSLIRCQNLIFSKHYKVSEYKFYKYINRYNKELSLSYYIVNYPT